MSVTDGIDYNHVAAAHAKIVDKEAGRVETHPRRTKVAIVGFAGTTRNEAPYDDPEWEIWGLNQLYRHIPRGDRWFEMHHREMFLRDTVRDTNYLQWLQETPLPIYMNECFSDIPNAVRYPIERMVQQFGDYFTSSIAYMIALAIAEEFTTIGCWGIDLVVGQEYEVQKPCAEYLLGIAMGRGYTVMLPKKTALLKTLFRYGYQEEPLTGPVSKLVVQKRLVELNAKRDELLTHLNNIDGMIGESKYYQTMLELHERGTAVMDVKG